MGILTITATSTDDVYTTTSYVKALMGTTATSDDATLSALIRAASRWADNYVGRSLSLQSYQELMPGMGRRNLMLSRYPLRSVSVVRDGTDSGLATTLLTSEYRVENRDAGFISRNAGFAWSATLMGRLLSDAAVPMSPTPMPGQEFKPWLVEYTAGYSYGGVSTSSPNWSTVNGSTFTGRTLPEDIEHAVALKTAEMYEGQDEVIGERLGDLEVNYRSGARDAEVASLSPAESILDPYRSLV